MAKTTEQRYEELKAVGLSHREARKIAIDYNKWFCVNCGAEIKYQQAECDTCRQQL